MHELAIGQDLDHLLGGLQTQSIGLGAPDDQYWEVQFRQVRPEIGLLRPGIVSPLLPDLEIVAPAELAVGEFLGGVGQAAAEHRLGAEPVLLALVGEYVLEGVEFLGNVLYLLGDTGRALWIKVRADVYDDHLLNLFGVAPGKGHAVAAAHRVADQDE